MLELGHKAKDKITGFEGIITGRATYLTGCDQYVLQPKMKKGEAKIPEGQWFDEGRIKLVGTGVAFTASEVAGPLPGGPQRDAPPA